MNALEPVHAFLDHDTETFSYVVTDLNTKLAVIIDPVLNFDYNAARTATTGAEEIIAYVKAHDLTVEWILETHAHADHLSAAQFLKHKLGAKIAIGEHIQTVQSTFKTIFNLEEDFLTNGEQFDRLLKEGETFMVGDMSINVIHTPGHTPADMSYLINNEFLFVGDTLFLPDVGTARCDFPGGDANTLYRSIHKLLSLPPSTALFVCHDYPPKTRSHAYQTTVGAQLKENIHVHEGISEEEFVKTRTARDKTLAMPRLILPSIQVNIRAGHLPPKEDNGTRYLKIPFNIL